MLPTRLKRPTITSEGAKKSDNLIGLIIKKKWRISVMHYLYSSNISRQFIMKFLT